MTAPPAALLDDTAEVAARVRAALAQTERVVAVMSGKGGVGKSVVAVNLALALARDGARVALLDADLHGPSVPQMLGLRGQPLRMQGERLRPVRGHAGIAVQSMDFFLQGDQALDWDGPAGEGGLMRSALEEAALADLLGRTDWEALDHLVIDLPPGADRLPALARWVEGVCAVAVTIPTEVAWLAVARSVRRALEARLPLIGVVENLAGSVCGECGAHAPLFPETDVAARARDLDTAVIARIPFDPALARAADRGRPFLEGAAWGSPAGAAFGTLADAVRGFDPARKGDSW